MELLHHLKVKVHPRVAQRGLARAHPTTRAPSPQSSPVRTATRASRASSSSAEDGRLAGSFSRHIIRMASSSPGMGSSETSDGGTGGVCSVVQQHLRRRVRLKEQLSGERPVGGARRANRDRPGHRCGSPEISSGAMNAGVPCRIPCTRQHRRVLARLILDDPEVQHLQVVVLGSEPRDEQVRRLDVAMHEPVLVRLGERPARLAQEHRSPVRRVAVRSA